MKKLFLLLLGGWLLGPSSAMAQSEGGGIYLTASDFLAGKLTFASVGKKGSNASAEDLLVCRRLVVHQSGIDSSIRKKDIYAVRCGDGKIVRTYRDGCYTLLNPGEDLLLYQVNINPCSKGDVKQTKYYFSRTAGGDIEELTIGNLKAAFRDNGKFNNALDTGFGTDSDLCAYDDLHRCYKLNRIYDISK